MPNCPTVVKVTSTETAKQQWYPISWAALYSHWSNPWAAFCANYYCVLHLSSHMSQALRNNNAARAPYNLNSSVGSDAHGGLHLSGFMSTNMKTRKNAVVSDHLFGQSFENSVEPIA
jgi:hypothetical protein